ncbi:MAG: deoxyguanosinetriphosphate triphosphohydrolase, partial [Cutibacterium acnes]|nr:deoxyguanosinetriphosphate triphosphohydrolase [Cutibacterium acnes]
TQVFLAPRGDHYRTRLTHVLEVSQIARTIARALRLNEDLTEAIALGHDLGHTPFGHAGETVLREIHPGGFDHYRQSLRVVDFLERNGKGLNLTAEVRKGILTHSKGRGRILPSAEECEDTIEAVVVRISDIIAYLNHDLDDALRAGVITAGDIPKELTRVLGKTHSGRIDTMVRNVIYNSLRNAVTAIVMDDEVLAATDNLRDFLFRSVYESEKIMVEFNKAKKILRDLYGHYLEHVSEVFTDIPADKKLNRHRMVCDFVAGMTDRFALMTFEQIFLPRQWTVL